MGCQVRQCARPLERTPDIFAAPFRVTNKKKNVIFEKKNNNYSVYCIYTAKLPKRILQIFDFLSCLLIGMDS